MARILVVDDDPDVLNLVVFRLRRHGHDVMSGDSGADALAVVAERGRPDLAVLDVNMPGMSGFELLSRLREGDEMSEVPVIFLSAKVQDEDVRAGRSTGATYLTKPFVASALISAVDRALAPGPVPDAGSVR